MGQKARRADLCYLSSSLKFPPAQKHSQEEAQAAAPECSMNHQFWQVPWFIVLGVQAKELGEILVSQSLMHCWQSKWPRVQGTWSQCLSHPSWSLAGAALQTLLPPCRDLYPCFCFLCCPQIRARTVAQSNTKHILGTAWAQFAFTRNSTHPDPFCFSRSWNRNSTQSTLIFPVYVQLLEEFCWPVL